LEVNNVDRFFSKLDLRDIKIQPETKFPPTEEDYDDNGIEEAWEDDDFETLEELSSNETSNDTITPYQATGEAVATEQRKDVLKVSARSRPSAVAGAIAGVVRENGRAEVQAIGAGATNQAVKAVAIARDYLRETDIEAVCLPAFIDVTIDNEDRTAIRIIVEPR
jgi:stage V sporulation protein S